LALFFLLAAGRTVAAPGHRCPTPGAAFLAPYGITMDELVNRMGGAI
jgi:hypothetical protein